MPIESDRDERRLISLAQKGDHDAMQDLLIRYRPLLYTLAGRIQCDSIDREELIQSGCIGFMHAVRHYDVNRGAKLSTYAVSWILGEMRQAIRRTRPAVTVLSLEEAHDKEGSTLMQTLCSCSDVDLMGMDIRLALEKLNEEVRILICLRYFRDKTQKETALLMKKSQAQISRMERQALCSLQALLS